MSTTESSSSHSILSEKVARALQVRTDTPAFKAALEALVDRENLDARTVRIAMEQDALQQALLLRKELERLVESVKDVRQAVSDCASVAHAVQTALATPVLTQETAHRLLHDSSQRGMDLATASSTNTTTMDPLEQEQRLAALLSDSFRNRNLARQRREAVDAFFARYDLSQQDSRLLDHYAFEDANDEHILNDDIVNGVAFLQALERVYKIRMALASSFDSSDNDTSLGTSSALRMMESLAQKQERAYERLYHWLQKYLHHLTQAQTESDLERLDEALSHDFLRRAFYVLRRVPAFYSHTLELVAASRRAEETRRFLIALTSGYGGLPPLEVKSHDSVGYVGDMLAFCFRAFSVEADVSKGLLLYRPAEEEEEEEKTPDVDADFGETPITAKGMLSISMSGLARPLKSRVLQVISSLARKDDEEDDEDVYEEESAAIRHRLTHLYEICGLILFYLSAMEKGIQKLETKDDNSNEEENPLVASLSECLVEATKAYEATIRVYCAMMEQLASVTGDSEATLAHSVLSLIAHVRMNSPGFASDISSPESCREILSIEWATETLISGAMAVCKALDDAVILKQAISTAKKAGMSVLTAERLDEQIDEREVALIDKLVENKTEEVLNLCGLGPIAKAFNSWKEQENGVMVAYPGLSQEDAEAAMKDFYASLYSPPIPSLETIIKDPLSRRTARSKIAKSVCEMYASLYDTMASEQGGYDDVSFLGHSPEQVDTLFSV